MQSLEELIKKLPPDMRAQVVDFIEFLLSRADKKPRPKMTCDWAGGLEHLRKAYTSIQLQEQANQWRVEDEMSR